MCLCLMYQLVDAPKHKYPIINAHHLSQLQDGNNKATYLYFQGHAGPHGSFWFLKLFMLKIHNKIILFLIKIKGYFSTLQRQYKQSFTYR